MRSDEEWPTLELIQAAVDRFTDRLPGWSPPAAYGVALVPVPVDGGPAWSFPVVNVGWVHRLPALVLGIVTGRRSGTGTVELSPADLRRAVDLLGPAEAATMLQHPNLRAWRSMLQQLDAGAEGRIVAVFVESLDDPVSSPYDAVLRSQVARGERSTLYTSTGQESRSTGQRAGPSVAVIDTTTTSGATMTDTQGIKTVLHPVSDLAKAKDVYAALLGVQPVADGPYYVGFEAAGQHIGLVPGGGPQGMTSPVAYWHVPDIEAKLAEVTAAGATVKEPAHDVGGGRLVATVTDPDGNVLGLLQDR